MHPQSSISAGASSSVASQPGRSGGLPLVPCPNCGVMVTKFVSRTVWNPNKVFYKCSNTNCRLRLWMWEEDYLTYLANANVITPSIESELVELIGTLESQLVKLIDELKKKSEDDDRQIQALVASLDNIKLHNHNLMYLIIAMLVVVIALLTVLVGIHK